MNVDGLVYCHEDVHYTLDSKLLVVSKCLIGLNQDAYLDVEQKDGSKVLNVGDKVFQKDKYIINICLGVVTVRLKDTIYLMLNVSW